MKRAQAFPRTMGIFTAHLLVILCRTLSVHSINHSNYELKYSAIRYGQRLSINKLTCESTNAVSFPVVRRFCEVLGKINIIFLCNVLCVSLHKTVRFYISCSTAERIVWYKQKKQNKESESNRAQISAST